MKTNRFKKITYQYMSIALIALNVVVFSNCAKEKFTPYDNPKYGVLYKYNEKIPAIRDYTQPEQGENVVTITDESMLQFDGEQYYKKKKVGEVWLRLLCDASTQSICKEGEHLYVDKEKTKKSLWIVLFKSQADNARNTRDFL